MSDPYGQPGVNPNQPPPWQQPVTPPGPDQPPASMPVSDSGVTTSYPASPAPGWQGQPEPPAQRPAGGTYSAQYPYGSQGEPPQYGTPQQPQQPQYGAPPSQPTYGTPSQPTYGTPSQPTYGTPSQPTYGTPSQPTYGTPSQPTYGTPSQPTYGTPSQPTYGTPQGQPAYGTPSQPTYGTPQDQPTYGTPQGQPGYGTPSQPTYGAPQGQPTYGASPQSPYGSAPGQPPYGGVPGQPPYGSAPGSGRSRGLIIAIVAVLAVLVIGGGVTAAVVLAGGDDKGSPATNAAPSADVSGTPGAGTATAGPTAGSGGKTVTLSAPDTIGSLSKESDQSQVAPLLDSLQSSGVDNAFAAAYKDTSASGRTVITWGGSGSAFEVGGQQTELDAFFKSAGASLPGGTEGSVQKVDPGSLGGTAECANVSGLGQTVTLCAWTNSEALLGFIFEGASSSQSQQLMRTMLPAIVKMS